MTISYLPSVSWWQQWLREGMTDLNLMQPYHKRMEINWCRIDSPNGELRLTVPIRKDYELRRSFPDSILKDTFSEADTGAGNPDISRRFAVGDVRISTHGDWQHKHWHALQSTYYNSPFFEYYEDDFRPLYERQYEYLSDFNLGLIEVCKELLGLNQLQLRGISCAESRENTVSADNHESGNFRRYYQVFAHKHGFIPNLSIFDLLMNMGPESLLYLMNENELQLPT